MLHHTHLKFKEQLQPRGITNAIILHHSEVLKDHSVEEVHQWHLNKGWSGIAYHYFVKKDGEIYEGRPRNTIGAHTYGNNFESIGVCFEGDFNKEKMEEQQMNESVILLLSLLSLAYQAPLHTHWLYNHEKNCPGNNFPFKTICDKVEACKSVLTGLFGVQKGEALDADFEWLHFKVGLDDQKAWTQHNAPIYVRDFNYMDLVNLMDLKR